LSNGRHPKIVAARTREAEYEALVRHVTAWREEGIEPHEIGIAVRSNWMGKEAAAGLNAAGIPTVSLSAKSRKNAVRIGTMHGMKGPEFQAVAKSHLPLRFLGNGESGRQRVTVIGADTRT
jgi:superfamily I DNA/RNA helicase